MLPFQPFDVRLKGSVRDQVAVDVLELAVPVGHAQFGKAASGRGESFSDLAQAGVLLLDAPDSSDRRPLTSRDDDKVTDLPVDMFCLDRKSATATYAR